MLCGRLETSVQLETHRRFCCQKNGQKPCNKPLPKHPVKVHVWGGISWYGATKVCIFDGIMNAERYISILELTLVPFVEANGHRFMQDNDPKHTSRRAAAFFEEKGIRWWRTTPDSPDANPIENLWHELKVCLLQNFSCTWLLLQLSIIWHNLNPISGIFEERGKAYFKGCTGSRNTRLLVNR